MTNKEIEQNKINKEANLKLYQRDLKELEKENRTLKQMKKGLLGDLIEGKKIELRLKENNEKISWIKRMISLSQITTIKIVKKF